MSQYKAIPQPNDQRNVSQNDILQNYAYLNNANGAAPSGVIPVDHLSTGDNGAAPSCGFHQQVSFINRSPAPTTLVNAVNGQSSSSIAYTAADGNGKSQLRFLNSLIDQPVTFIKSAGVFNGAGVIQGNAFNVASITVGAVGEYTINFNALTPMASLNYIVLGMVLSGSGSHTASSRTLTYRAKNLTDVTVTITTNGTYTSPQEVSFMIIGFF